MVKRALRLSLEVGYTCRPGIHFMSGDRSALALYERIEDGKERLRGIDLSLLRLMMRFADQYHS